MSDEEEATRTPTELLMEGARYGDVEDVAVALKQGADVVNFQDERGRSGSNCLHECLRCVEVHCRGLFVAVVC